MEKINWDQFCNNPHPRAIEIIEENVDKANWQYLSSNPAAIYFLEQNKDKIVWPWFSKNPAIFEIGLDNGRKKMHTLPIESIIKV
jgi:hypothetical protein